MTQGNPFITIPRPTKAFRTKGYEATSPLRPELSLKGKTVLITGGATGIGLAISQALAQAGASTLALLSRSSTSLSTAKSLLESSHPSTKILTFPASITDSTRVNQILAELGTVDVLVLNAGVSHALKPLLQISEEEVEENFRVNVLGPMNVLRAFVALKPRKEGAERTVIHTSSGGIHLQVPGTGVYAASKAAMTNLISKLDAEHRSEGIRAFSFHPAVAYTDMAKGAGFPEDGFGWDDVSLAANQVVWFCSPEADFLKGRFVWSNWDVEELMAKKKFIEEDPSQLTISLVQDKVLA